MENKEMIYCIQDFCDCVKKNISFDRNDILERVQTTINKLQMNENLNIDDKKSLNDLFLSVLNSSDIKWYLIIGKVHCFNNVRNQLGCFDIDDNLVNLKENNKNVVELQDSRLNYKYDVGIICSVRSSVDKEYIEEYVQMLESKGVRVFYPARDTNQNDSSGIRICRDNRASFMSCREIHVIFHPESQGTLFDLGMVFERKPIKVVNPLERTEHKSFKNVLIDLTEENKGDILFGYEYNREIEIR